MKKLLPLILLIVVSFHSEASDRKGNGGNALVCFRTKDVVQRLVNTRPDLRMLEDSDYNHIDSITALDYVEATFRKTPDFQNVPLVQYKDSSPENFALRLVNQTESKLPGLKKNLLSHIGTFSKEVNAYGGVYASGIQQIFDFGALDFNVDNNKCLIVTVIWHKKSVNGFELYIDEELFFHPKHSNISRGVFYLHEWLYSFARTLPELADYHQDSTSSRKVVQEFLRRDFSARNLFLTLQNENFIKAGDNNLQLEILGKKQLLVSDHEKLKNQFNATVAEFCRKVPVEVTLECYRYNVSDLLSTKHRELTAKVELKNREINTSKNNLQRIDDSIAKLPRYERGRNRGEVRREFLHQLYALQTSRDANVSDLARLNAELQILVSELAQSPSGSDIEKEIDNKMKLHLAQTIESILSSHQEFPLSIQKAYQEILNGNIQPSLGKWAQIPKEISLKDARYKTLIDYFVTLL